MKFMHRCILWWLPDGVESSTDGIFVDENVAVVGCSDVLVVMVVVDDVVDTSDSHNSHENELITRWKIITLYYLFIAH